STARPSDISKQQLKHRRRANHLRSECVLSPANRVNDRRDFLHITVLANRGEHIRNLEELVFVNSGDPCNYLGRVAGVLLLEQLKYASRMLKRRIISSIGRKHRRRL